MSDLAFIGTLLLGVIMGIGYGSHSYWKGFFKKKAQSKSPPPDSHVSSTEEDFYSDSYVQVDCRECGQVNRVPPGRLRNRPICGKCKIRLMPKSRIVYCHVEQMNPIFKLEINALWNDADRIWKCIEDHFNMRKHSHKQPESELN